MIIIIKLKDNIKLALDTSHGYEPMNEIDMRLIKQSK